MKPTAYKKYKPQLNINKMEDILKTLNYQPTNLTTYEIENPLSVITDFIGNYALHDMREKVWELYKGWVYYSYDFAEGKENTEMLFFYSQLISFLNASYIYTEKKKHEISP